MNDRAAVVATAITAIITDALKAWLRGTPSSLSAVRKEIEVYLRGEFDECAREARRDLTLTD